MIGPESPYQILFEPVPIGPVTAPNRFFQVAHCNGLGHRFPKSLAALRGMKAEGGWGVVCTEEVEIHHTSDLSPFHEGRLWNDDDIHGLKIMVEAVHQHQSLAAIELVYSGMNSTNLYSRVPPMGPRSMGISGGCGFDPVQSRRMDKEDIRNVRRWHRNAALRAKQAGFDIIYCYAGHGLTLPMQFMMRRYNDRTDEYGGSLENRVRFFREIIEETKDAVGDRCAVAVRFAVDELLGDYGITSEGEGHDIVAMLAELPDLWDVNISGWTNDSATSRFAKEGYQERYTAFVKKLTTKPVVGVGRYTSPDSMVSAVKRGVLDFIGAARPSIADPFLPNKIKNGQLEDIRECIGCNICVAGDMKVVPIRCTQNPTMGEEWRRGWHPEKISAKKSNKPILVIGGGPAGLECARALGQRGYDVTLTDSRREIGGRVLRESALPGLSEWRRVAEWRLAKPQSRDNVQMFPGSTMSVQDVLDTGIRDVIVATGCHYRRDGIGRTIHSPIPGHDLAEVFTPDDLMDGKRPRGKVLIYDDDHFYMGGVLAELLATQGCDVTVVTAAPQISYWTQFTLEQEKIEKKLLGLGVRFLTRHTPQAIYQHAVALECAITGAITSVERDGVVLVTDRKPHDTLYQQLKPHLEAGTLNSLKIIGDAEAPSTIAQAVYAGHLAAREFDEIINPDLTPFKLERPLYGHDFFADKVRTQIS
jgi:dimethylamine/trimethylamine dehydrogenase